MSFLLLHNDQSLDASISSSSSYESNLPPSQLNNELIRAVTRTQSAVTTYVIKLNLAGSGSIDAFALVNHNLTSSGTVRLQVFTTDARSVQSYDSGSLSISAGSDVLDMVTQAWTFTAQTDRYLTVTLTDATLSYIEVGRIFVGERLVTDTNMNFGAQMIPVDDSSIRLASAGGVNHHIRQQPTRAAAFKLDLQLLATGLDHFEMQMRQGICRQVIFQKEENDWNSGLYTFIGTLEKLSPVVHNVPLRNSFNTAVIEQR